jgi:divalent metal cation (Fe/Co/Zn/Cd) transporter
MPGLSSIDLTILVSPDISVRESHDIESRVRERIHIHGVEPGEMEVLQEEKRQGGSDFGRDGC